MNTPPPHALTEARDTLSAQGSLAERCVSLSLTLLMVALLPPFGATAVAFAFALCALSLLDLIERPGRLGRLCALQLTWDTPTCDLSRGGRALLSLTVHNPSPTPIDALHLWLRGPEGPLLPRPLHLPAGASATLRYEVEARWVGQWRLWGVEVEWSPPLALSPLRLHRPLPLSVSVDFGPAPLPAPLFSGRPLTTGDASASSPYQDEGDFQELRPYQLGDGQRRVAWRASARAGALLSRVYELPRQQRVLLALDVGPLMREALPQGARPLDLALDAAARYLRAARAVPVGLALFDHRLLGVVAPSLAPPEGPLALLRHATQLVDLDCLDAAEAHLAELLGDALVWKGALDEEQRDWSDLLAERLKRRRADLETLLPAGHLSALDAHNINAHLFALSCLEERVPTPFRKARSSQERARGLSALVTLADQQGVTDLILLSRAEGLGRAALAPLAAWAGRGGSLLWLEAGLNQGDPRAARAALAALALLSTARGSVELGAQWGGRARAVGGRGVSAEGAGAQGVDEAQRLSGVRLSCAP